MDKKVFAVIVTYKRAVVLKECLKAVLELSTYKVEQLHIIVNAKEIETLETIEKFSSEKGLKVSFEICDNVGPAGGFYYGLKEFLKSDCDYVWLMDDDVVPEPNCLEDLINGIGHSLYAFPKVVNPEGKEIQTLAFGWWGVLLRKALVEKVGLPIKEFFYWCEDTEYLQNRMIRKNGVIPYRSDNAVVTHLHNRNGNKPQWYYYYTIRNTLYYRSRIFPLNIRGFIRIGYMFAGAFYRILFKEPDKLSQTVYLIMGLYHAVIGKLGKLERLHKKEMIKFKS